MVKENTNNGWSRDRILKVSLLTFIGIVGLALVIRLSTVFIPVGIALLLAFILEPVITYMDRHHSRRGFTVSFVYALLLVFILGIGVLVGPPLLDQGQDFVFFVKEKSDEYGITEEIFESGGNMEDSSQQKSRGWWSSLFSDNEEKNDSLDPKPKSQSSDDQEEGEGNENLVDGEMSDQIGRLVKQHASTVGNKLLLLAVGGSKAIFDGASSVATFLMQFVLVLFYAFFFMLHFPAIQKVSTRWVPPPRQREVNEVLKEIGEVVSGFFRGRLLVCGISAIVTSIGLFISGIDFWLILGISAGFLGIIPFIGVTLTFIPTLLIAFASEQSLFSVICVLVTFGIVQGFVEPFVGPFVISHKVSLHPVTLTVALLAGGVLFGVLGLFLAIPACGILKILAQRYLVPAVKSVMSG